MKQMQDNAVEMTLTDIPYDVVNRESNGLRNLDKKNADTKTFSIESIVDEIVRVASGSIYIFCSTEQVSFIRSKMVDLGLTTRLCIWEKSNPSPMNGQYIWLSGIECCVYGKKKGATFNEHCKNTVWKYPVPKSKFHPTQKPQKLFEYLINTSSMSGDLIFDPCGGSGTTAFAAKNTNRNFLICEIEQTYVNSIKERLNSA